MKQKNSRKQETHEERIARTMRDVEREFQEISLRFDGLRVFVYEALEAQSRYVEFLKTQLDSSIAEIRRLKDAK